MEAVVLAIVEEMGLKLPSLKYITSVAVPKGYRSLALTLYTTHDLDHLPTGHREDVERLRVRLGSPPSRSGTLVANGLRTRIAVHRLMTHLKVVFPSFSTMSL